MFILKSKHNKIVSALKQTAENEAIKNSQLRQELSVAKDLKSVIEKLSDKTIGLTGNFDIGSYSDAASHIEERLSDAIPRYVDDFFGGKVIKQEATKVIHITKEGGVQTGLTKKPADKGYTYLLKRD